MTQARALRLLLMAVVLFGGVWPVTKDALRDATPLWFGFSRAALAAVATALLMAGMGRLRLPGRADRPTVLAVGTLQIGAFFALAHAALLHVPAGRTAVLANVTIFWLVPLSVWMLGEAVSARRWVAAAIGLAGVAVMTGPWAFDWSAPGMLSGHALLLGASLCWSLAIVITRLRPPQTPMIALLPTIFTVGALVQLPVALWREPYGGLGWDAAFQAGFIGLFAAPVGTWALIEAGRNLNAVVASLGFLLVPVVGVALATLWLGEPLGWDLLLGGALVVLSVVLAAKG
ncbi:DMT family transporter [Sabulicella rubraurantiaca]|uniref:DMT family transporter n=1 Tax=Sabulicella rubraurantiaca TaxID=2811429 RepID=UPI002E2C908C|nr:DMT family transporter [Sabulicella rubraurantiaca]